MSFSEETSQSPEVISLCYEDLSGNLEGERNFTYQPKLNTSPLVWQANTVPEPTVTEPANRANVTGVNRAAVTLDPGLILLTDPVPEVRIIIGRLHVDVTAHIHTTGHAHLLLEELATSVTDGIEWWLLDVVVEITSAIGFWATEESLLGKSGLGCHWQHHWLGHGLVRSGHLKERLLARAQN